MTERITPTDAAPDLAPLWRSVDRMIADAVARGDVDGIRAHKLGPLAAAWYERSQLRVPPGLHEEQRAASFGAMLAPALVEKIRSAVDGEIVLLKGPEVAARYPHGGRRFSDIDLLVRDADAAQAALLRAGFVEAEEDAGLDDHHHLHPLRLPAIWLGVEVHAAPNWPPHAPVGPPLEEIFASAVPCAVGVDGVSAPRPLHHALLLAAHGWRHQPLNLVRDLLDIAALAERESRIELAATADRWGIGRIWRTTSTAGDALFAGGPEPLPFKLWARHLRRLRPQTVLEEHLQRWLHPFWEQPPAAAVADALRMVRDDIKPARGQTWPQKLAQSLDALLHLGASAESRNRQ